MSRERRNREESIYVHRNTSGHSGIRQDTSSIVLESVWDGGKKTFPFYPTTELYSEPKEKGETTALKVM